MSKSKTKNTSESIITPPGGWAKLNLGEIFDHKELLYIFVWRNIKVRYKQTIIGIGWVVFQPFFNMIIFTIIFSKLVKIPSENLPYPIFIFAGLIFWGYFNSALYGANNSLVDAQAILKKIYFPRLIIPMATTITPVIDFLLVFLIYLGLMFYFHTPPHFLGLIIIPLLVLITFLAATGLGLLLASINARYRDVQYILGLVLQVMFYATPIIYPLSVVPQAYHWIFYLNPLSAPIMIARSTLFQVSSPEWKALVLSAAISIILFFLGIVYFKRSERYFADEL